MPRKIDPDQTYGEKVIRLFARLLFSNRPHSLTEPADALGCSKQTVSRILDEIEKSMGIDLERAKSGKEAIYAIKNRKPPPAAYLSQSEIDLLWMCRAFAERLVGKGLFDEIQEALFKSQTLVEDGAVPSSDLFASFFPGTIDYTPHQDTIRTLIEAMNQRQVCKVTYKAAASEKAKTFHIKPLKIFTHKDTLYLHALRAKDPWRKKWVEPEFNPLLAIHRFKKVEKADRAIPFEIPKEYDFEKAFNQTFGIIKEKSFHVEAEFTGWAAVYVSERLWSPDQVIEQERDKVRIRFTSSSEEEVVSWILSFGECAKLLEPESLVALMRNRIGILGETDRPCPAERQPPKVT
ncbi:MAG: WYL domain-containing protein [Pseudomonadota bacterium]